MRSFLPSWYLSFLVCLVSASSLDDGFKPIPNIEALDDDPTALRGYKLSEAAERDGAVCLDGTPGVYYHRPGADGKWFVFHEGGGWCSSLEECYRRSKTDLGSSAGYSSTISGSTGVEDPPLFSTDPRVNPLMHDWNVVYFKYCDGNSFTGSNQTVTAYKDAELHFRGKRILDAGISDLLLNRGLDGATEVVVSGCSAGGLSAFLHCDHWGDRIAQHSPHARVVCVPDSGLFLDYNALHYHDDMVWAFHQQNSSLSPDCVAEEFPPSKCIFAEIAMKHIRRPTFPLQSAYDSWQLQHDLGSKDICEVNEWGKNLTALVRSNLLLRNKYHGIFLDSCVHHCFWQSISIDDDTMATAMMKWYKSFWRTDSKHIWMQNKSFPCVECCS